jgi:hypothetical protein
MKYELYIGDFPSVLHDLISRSMCRCKRRSKRWIMNGIGHEHDGR